MDKTNIKEINLKVGGIIRQELSEVAYNTWFNKYLEYAFMEGNNIVIEVENLFEKAILEEKYLSLLDNAYSQFMDELNYSKISILVRKADEDELEGTIEFTAKEARELADEFNTETSVKKQIMEELEMVYRMIRSCSKSGEYTFETTVDYSATHLITKGIIESLEKNGYKVTIRELNDGKAGLVIEW